ncbi:TRAP transporter substrate-binding protein [Terrihabitans rhizophilus]|uniref:TRAP transporter substrate-binding protein n=1 Tax=Terrihabitans rhizophilus TaxID=3092662 RepID=A0ABU4RK18_9HYPH|nr:TRAP transporter substrate-binding protein [Terrihabitans sp. PJ23]MDX6804911.1 TRAP transporter substrate-binding protein [Terrihabitans sp. PJ23]
MKHLATAALFLALGTVSSAAQDVQSRLIRFGYGLNEDSVQGRAVRKFAEDVEKASGGKMKVRSIGAASLGPDTQMQSALVGGAQEMMVGSTATLVGTVKEFGIWDTPFLFANEKEADAVLDGPTGQKLLDMLPEKGLVGLVYWENGFRNLTNSRKQITKAEDVEGLKVRVMQNQVALGTFKAVGANAVPMAFSELFTALETKAVDGQENPFTTILSSKFYEVQKYLTVTNHMYSPWVVLVSKKWWDKLSADEQKILKDAAIASRTFEREDNRATSAKALEDLKSGGMDVATLPEAEIAKFRDKSKDVIDQVIASVGKPLWDEVQAEITTVRGK